MRSSTGRLAGLANDRRLRRRAVGLLAAALAGLAFLTVPVPAVD